MMTHLVRWTDQRRECLGNHLDHQDLHHHAHDQAQDLNTAQVQVQMVSIIHHCLNHKI